MISLEDDMAQSMERALLFGAFLNSLSAPTPVQLWLERAAADLQHQRDPDGGKRAHRGTLKVKVMERDGSDCWFCAKPLGGDVSLEHLQPLALGGSWSLNNLALAHRSCNRAAGHLTRIKKEALRAASADRSPQGQDGNRLDAKHESAVPKADAQKEPS